MHFAALYVVFGGASFWLLSAPGTTMSAGAARPVAATAVLLRVAAPVAAVSGVAWLAGTIAYATGGLASLADPAMLRVFFLETPFGTPASIRLALLGALMAVGSMPMKSGLRTRSYVVVGAALLVSQAWLGHANEGGATSYGFALIATYAVHVLATAAWVGGLPPLAFVVAAARWEHAGQWLHAFLMRYSTVATIAVVLIVASGSANTLYHAGGSLADLRSTAYGSVLLTKVTLVAVMLGLASLNRFVLMPSLCDAADVPLRRLQFSVAFDMLLALLVLGAAAVLGITPPPG